MGKFEVGDLVKGFKGNGCYITDENMTKAEILEYDSYDNTYLIRVLEHKESGYVDDLYWTSEDELLLLEESIEPKQEYKSSKRSNPKSKAKKQPKQTNNGLPFNIKVKEKNGLTFLVIDKKHTICIEGSFGVSSVNGDTTDVFNEEIGEALSLYRMNNKKENK